jgi:hypothetical protein
MLFDSRIARVALPVCANANRFTMAVFPRSGVSDDGERSPLWLGMRHCWAISAYLVGDDRCYQLEQFAEV